MNPIQPEELSAFLDGELSAQRMREVQQQLDVNVELRAQFDTLQRLDRQWHAASLGARFKPSIQLLPLSEPRSRVLGILALGTALAALRLLLKIFDAQIVLLVLVNAGLLAALLGATLWLINRESERQGLLR